MHAAWRPAFACSSSNSRASFAAQLPAQCQAVAQVARVGRVARAVLDDDVALRRPGVGRITRDGRGSGSLFWGVGGAAAAAARARRRRRGGGGSACALAAFLLLAVDRRLRDTHGSGRGAGSRRSGGCGRPLGGARRRMKPSVGCPSHQRLRTWQQAGQVRRASEPAVGAPLLAAAPPNRPQAWRRNGTIVDC